MSQQNQESANMTLDRRMFMLTALAAGTVAASASAVVSAQVAQTPNATEGLSPVVETALGSIRGARRDRVFSF